MPLLISGDTPLVCGACRVELKQKPVRTKPFCVLPQEMGLLQEGDINIMVVKPFENGLALDRKVQACAQGPSERLSHGGDIVVCDPQS